MSTNSSEIDRILHVTEIPAPAYSAGVVDVNNNGDENGDGDEILSDRETRVAAIPNTRWFHASSVPTNLERTYGGQLVAQALAAANATVDKKKLHSLHTYFLKGGDAQLGIDVQVELVRDGRSFANRRVRVFQNEVEICHVSVSYHRSGDTGPSYGHDMPAVPKPETTPRAVFEDFSKSHTLDHSGDWDALVVPQEKVGDGFAPGNRLSMWIRYNGAITDGDNHHAAALGYISDSTLLSNATALEPDRHVQMASLDHSMWIFAPFRVDDWLLYDQWSPAAGAERGFAMGRFFTSDGRLVAMATQEGLVRDHR
ncbi:acyl-CoA thioesterase [Corynebacterium propinquum]|uniref:acyl-CoA thioesterase n=1 Tax=Corynebacterium propinquum TaxID=43769 RepID=UPI0020BF93DE|nr:acyl-CoA thioesterase domain-containing protein [Corynebacterium propinquum]UQV59390.1 thioesterase family protein [Corynebacterium propinquum]